MDNYSYKYFLHLNLVHISLDFLSIENMQNMSGLCSFILVSLQERMINNLFEETLNSVHRQKQSPVV